MTGLGALTRRNCKLFFQDKGMFFSAMITPAILLVLYATFLGNVYRDSFSMGIAGLVSVPEQLIDAAVGGELVSSLLAVCCVTVAFCSNMLMVQDKVTGARRDLTMTPVRKPVLALSYYLATVISTLIVCLIAAGLCFAYLAKVGWYLSVADVAYLLLDTVLLVLFGTALSSIINLFLSSRGRFPRWEPSSARAMASSAGPICRFPNSARGCRRRCPSCPAPTARPCCAIMPCGASLPAWRIADFRRR